MTTSRLGLRLIKDFEGLRLDSYKCPAGVWTIGYGHTKGVKAGMVIDNKQADDYLIEDIAPIERFLNGMSINFRQEEFDALVSWIFNLGLGNFTSSTLFKLVLSDASDESSPAALFHRGYGREFGYAQAYPWFPGCSLARLWHFYLTCSHP